MTKANSNSITLKFLMAILFDMLTRLFGIN